MRGLAAALVLTLGWLGAPMAADQTNVWSIETLDDGFVALTTNDSGFAFGQACILSSGNCLYTLTTDDSCHEGEQYPALVSSKGGAFHVDLHCLNGGARNVLVFTDFDSIDKIVRTDQLLGIATAQASGTFRVQRFSLSGAGRIIDIMRRRVTKAQEQKAKSTSDQSL